MLVAAPVQLARPSKSAITAGQECLPSLDHSLNVRTHYSRHLQHMHSTRRPLQMRAVKSRYFTVKFLMAPDLLHYANGALA